LELRGHSAVALRRWLIVALYFGITVLASSALLLVSAPGAAAEGLVQPTVSQSAAGISRTRATLDMILRYLLGPLAGVALAFLVDYLDLTLRGAADVERAQVLSVLGEVLTARGRPTRPRGH